MPFRFSRVEKAKPKPKGKTGKARSAEQDVYAALADLSNLSPADLARLANEIEALGPKYVEAYLGGAGDFAVTSTEAKRYAKRRSAKLVADITAEQRQLVRDATFESVRGDMTVNGMARDDRIRGLGLHTRWARAVENLRERTAQQYVKQGFTMEKAGAKADVVAERYRKSLIRKRAKVIARTEIMSAQNAGKYDGIVKAIGNGTLAHDTQLEFMTAEDEKVCPICGPLNGVKIGVAQTFTDGLHYPPMHPNCRCTITPVPADIENDPLYSGSEQYVGKAFDPSEARDDNGRWTAGFSAPLHKQEQEALYRYTLNSFGTNMALRRGEQPHTEGIDSAMAKASLPEETYATRVINDPGVREAILARKPHLDLGFMSATKHAGNAYEPTGAERQDMIDNFDPLDEPHNRVVMHLSIPKGTRAIDIGDKFTDRAGSMPDQHEVLIDRGTKWSVTAVNPRKDGSVHVQLAHPEQRTTKALDPLIPVLKFNPQQARDSHGRWTSGGGGYVHADQAEESGLFKPRYAESVYAHQEVGGRIAMSEGAKHMRGALVINHDEDTSPDMSPEERDQGKWLLEHGKGHTLAAPQDHEYDGPSRDDIETPVPATGVAWYGEEWTESWREPGDPRLATTPEELDRARAASYYAMAAERVGAQWGRNTNYAETAHLQDAARDEFNLRSSALSNGEFEKANGGVSVDYGPWQRTPAENYAVHGYMQAYSRAQYQHTQDYLKSKGIDGIEVYRGVATKDPLPEGEYDVKLRPLSSYTTDKSEADRFAGGAANGNYGFTRGTQGAVLREHVPAERVWAIGGKGPGFRSSEEVVVLGGHNRTHVTQYVEAPEVPRYSAEELATAAREAQARDEAKLHRLLDQMLAANPGMVVQRSSGLPTLVVADDRNENWLRPVTKALVLKFNPQEARDDHGRWTTGIRVGEVYYKHGHEDLNGDVGAVADEMEKRHKVPQGFMKSVTVASGENVLRKYTAKGMADSRTQGFFDPGYKFYAKDATHHGMLYYNPEVPSKHATIAHELGHVIDNHMQGGEGFRSQEKWRSVNGPWEDFRFGVKGSDEYKALASATTAHAKYAMDPTEIFARAYAQHIMEGSSDPALAQSWEAYKANPGYANMWYEKSYYDAQIRPHMDRILKTFGRQKGGGLNP